jgi:hypothetical protein
VSESSEPLSSAPGNLIRVFELGDWVYCNLAWKRRAEGAVRTAESAVRIEEGRTWHLDHGTTVVRSARARKLGLWCLALALILIVLAFLSWLAGAARLTRSLPNENSFRSA